MSPGGRFSVQELTFSEIEAASQEFRRREFRDPIYRVSTKLMEDVWNHDRSATVTLADAVSVLLLVWNGAFYRYGPLDTAELGKAIRKHKSELDVLRSKDIRQAKDEDIDSIGTLFTDTLDATSIHKGVKKASSPVSAAKTLHLLAPDYFPLWDNAIAVGWGCRWYGHRDACVKYQQFMRLTRDVMKKAENKRLTLKKLDECNFAIYTKDWYTPKKAHAG